MEENKSIDNKEMLTVANNANLYSDKNNMMYSPAQLAYAGDAVYELLVRSHIIRNHDTNVNKMHRLSVKFVRADAQAHLVSCLEDELTEEEKRIVKRGRNAKVTSSPKNAEMMNYRYATGFEALMGYLYLSNELGRLMELFGRIIEIIERDEKDEDN